MWKGRKSKGQPYCRTVAAEAKSGVRDQESECRSPESRPLANSAARDSKNRLTSAQSARISSRGSGSASASLYQVRLLSTCW